MPQYPVDHVATVGSPGSRHPIRIGVRQCSHMVNGGHDILIRLATPVVPNFFREFLPVSDRSSWIWHYNQISSGGHDLRVPAIGPAFAPLTLRTSVDQK